MARQALLGARAVPLASTLLVVGCTAVPAAGQARQARQAGQAGQAGTSRSSVRPRRMLEVRPAPYRLPAAVSGEAVSPDGRGLLVSGGLLADQSSSDSVIRVNVRTGRSAVSGHLAMPVHDAASAVLGGRLLVFGGGTYSSSAAVQRPSTGAVQRPSTGTGAVYGTLPAPRSDLLAVTEGATTYLAGGHSGGTYATTVLATTDGRHFRVVARLPLPVRYPGVVAAGSELWIFGGLTPAGPASAVQQVNLRTGRARLAGRLPHPLAAAAAFALDGTIYVAGGLTPGSPARAAGSSQLVTSSAVLRFDRAGPSFAAAGRLPVPVAHAGIAVTKGVAYLVGGLDGSRTVGAVTTFQMIRRPSPVTRRPGG
jgi:hypothetical protein